MDDHDTPTILITGASTGIGAATALRFDRLGCRVFAGVRKEADAERLAEQASDRLTPLRLDVTDADAIQAAHETVGNAVGAGGLTALVNNAGIVVGGPLELLPIHELRRQLDVNVIGQVALTQALIPLVRRARGRIVNVGSTSGIIAAPFMAPYAASKFALRAITDALRLELRPWGIRVTLIEVGPVATTIWEKSIADMDARWNEVSPEGRALYGQTYEKMHSVAKARARLGIPVEQVVDAIVHATLDPHPKTRYNVGPVARQFKLLALLPDPLRDRLVLRHIS